jgi:hypothetical protein
MPGPTSSICPRCRLLANFVDANRAEIIDRCRGKVAKRLVPAVTPAEIDHGVPMFLDQLKVDLVHGRAADAAPPSRIAETAAEHGHDLMRQGFTPSQVVHDYGDVCQSITELAIEKNAAIAPEDFRMLNMCLDDAIAAAITEYTSQITLANDGLAETTSHRLKILSDAMGTALADVSTALLAVRNGEVELAGGTDKVLDRNLQALQNLNGQLQMEVLKARRL